MNAAVWLRKPYEEYVKLSNEQAYLRKTGEDERIFRIALRKLVNLESIKLLSGIESHGPLSSLVQRTFCPPDLYYCPTILKEASRGIVEGNGEQSASRSTGFAWL